VRPSGLVDVRTCASGSKYRDGLTEYVPAVVQSPYCAERTKLSVLYWILPWIKHSSLPWQVALSTLAISIAVRASRPDQTLSLWKRGTVRELVWTGPSQKHPHGNSESINK
jgi:hypothetical protein